MPLIYVKGGHTEEYEIALGVIGTYNQINAYKKQMQFWDEHSTVFGSACIIVVDTHKKEYWPYYGRPYASLSSDLDEPEGKYIVASVFPSNLEDFKLFSEWCSQKYYHFYHGPIFDEYSYWENIRGNLFADEYLINNLRKLEEERNSVDRLPSPWGPELCPDELAKKYFFFYGDRDASKGKEPYLSDDLYFILVKVLTGPLSVYASVVSQYMHGYRTALMVAFLRGQKKRLDNDENIRVPAATLDSYTKDKAIKLLNILIQSEATYDSLRRLTEFPWFKELREQAPDFSSVYKILIETTPTAPILSQNDKLAQGCSNAFKSFFDEYSKHLKMMVDDRVGRVAYISRMIEKLYVSPHDYLYLDKLEHMLNSDTLEEIEVPISDGQRKELSEIRLVTFYRKMYGFNISALLERDLQVDGITIKDGWIESKQVDPKAEVADKSQVVLELGQVTENKPTIVKPGTNLNRDFSALFDTEPDAHACLGLLKSLNLIGGDNKHRIGGRDKAQLMALVEALQQKHLLPSARSTSDLTSLIAKQIGLDYKRPRNADRKKYDDFLSSYLNKLNAISIKDLTWPMVADNGR